MTLLRYVKKTELWVSLCATFYGTVVLSFSVAAARLHAVKMSSLFPHAAYASHTELACFWCAVWNGAAPFQVATRHSLDLRQSNHALAGGNRTPSSADVHRESRTADLPEGAPVEANEASQAIGACTACGRVYGDRMRLFLRGSVAFDSIEVRCAELREKRDVPLSSLTTLLARRWRAYQTVAHEWTVHYK